jgi:hypothetical protein
MQSGKKQEFNEKPVNEWMGKWGDEVFLTKRS